MIANGFVSIGGAQLGDLTGVNDPEVIRSMLTKALPDRKPRAINIFVGYWKRFLWEAQAGDVVVLPTQQDDLAIGDFVGPYFYVRSAEPRARHRREVAWNATEIPRDSLATDLLTIVRGRHTVQQFKPANSAHRLRTIAETSFDPGP